MGNNLPSSTHSLHSNIDLFRAQSSNGAGMGTPGHFSFTAPTTALSNGGLSRHDSLRSLSAIDLNQQSPALQHHLNQQSHTPNLLSQLPSLLHQNGQQHLPEEPKLLPNYLNGNLAAAQLAANRNNFSLLGQPYLANPEDLTNASVNNEQFCNVKRHMTLIQKLVTEHAKAHGPGCKFVKNFALCKSIWELNRLSKKNPHVSLMKKMLQEMPEKECADASG